MKKNITINLFGSLYAIDEDACQLLEKYLDNMKAYFAKREGGDEIADDIEHRVAEILSDLKAEGTEAISIEHVQDIIRRIGNPEQMDEAAPDAPQPDEAQSGEAHDGAAPEPPAPPAADEKKRRKERFADRKLYRDPDDKILGGVMSGLCKYFGGNDPLPWRIIFLLLCLASFSTMGIVYLVAWAIIPQADTAEERLRMQGRPVNPSTLNEEIMKQAEAARNYMSSPQFQRHAHGVADTLVRIVVFLLQLVLLAVCTATLIGILTFAAFIVYAMCATPDPDNADWIKFMQIVPAVQWGIWGAVAFASAFLCILIYAVLRWMLKHDRCTPISTTRRLTLLILAIVSFVAAMSCSIATGVRLKQESDAYRIKENSAGGYFLWNSDRDTIEEDGWNILTYEHCNPNGWCVGDTDSWTARNSRNSDSADDDDDDDYDYDDAAPSQTHALFFEHDAKDPQPMKVHFNSVCNKPAGFYKLAVVGRTNGDQTIAYATADYVNYTTVPIPAYTEGKHGNLRDKSAEELASLGLLTDSAQRYDEQGLKRLVDSWSYAESGVFYHKGGTLKVGFTNCPEFATHTTSTGRATSRFSIRSVKLIPVQAPATAAPAAAATDSTTHRSVYKAPHQRTKSPSKK